jgi:hypothetical protein
LDPARVNDQLATDSDGNLQRLLPILKAYKKKKFHRFVTGDESWFTLKLHRFLKRSISRDDVPQTVEQQIGTKRVMLTIIWGIDGFRVVDLMTEQHTVLP